MSNYWDPVFLKHLQGDSIHHVCEVGARYGDESIMLSNIFTKAQILSFECNPVTVERCRQSLALYPSIKFFDHGLGASAEVLPFYSYTQNNDGASSLHKRIDFDATQKCTGQVVIKTLASVLTEENIHHLDLLCMDIQGHELSVLKGCGDFLSKIDYVIMEEPKPVINTAYLPNGVHSKYTGVPTSAEISEYMRSNNFIEIERVQENLIEDNVMYKRV